MIFLTRIMAIVCLVVGIIIPAVGTIILLRKEPTRTTVALLLTNMATITMNVAYAFMLTASSMPESQMAMKIEYIGSAMFIVFFILFLYRYLRVNFLKFLFPIWTVFEAVYLFIILSGDPRELVMRNQQFEHVENINMNVISYESGEAHKVRFCMMAAILICLMITTAIRHFKTPIKRERMALRRVQMAELIIFVTSIFSVSVKMPFDITPVAMAVSAFVLDMGLICGGLLRVTDMGRDWAFENVESSFIILDASYRYLDCNEEAKKVFPELRYLPQERRIPQELFDLLLSDSEDIEYNDRKYKKTELNMDQDGDIMGHTFMLTDVTERLALMESLKEETRKANEANEAKSKFVSTISHEIRTPMNAIVGITDILLRKKRDKEDTDYLMNIKSSGDALLLIINDILDYSKIEAGQMKVIPDEYVPAIMISDLHMLFVTRIGSKPVELKYDIMEDLPGKLYGDALRIRQIIINYMNNAIKFTDEGSVMLSVKSLGEEDGVITLEFAVTDTGMGIKEEDIGKLFGSFSQVDEKKNHSKEGTGLGLAICKQLAELMGGSVGVESTYGEGSKFYARIPQKIIEREPAKNIERKSEEEFNFECPSVKLLLVDDNEMNLKVAKGLLEPLKMDITTAMNGKQAMEEAFTKKYDVVFMDHMMPIMDGVTATCNIREKGKEDEYFNTLPIIALTANVTEEAREEFDSCGMNAFLAKPMKMKDVCATLKEILPEDKLVPVDPDKKAAEYAEGTDGGAGTDESSSDAGIPDIPELNVKAGIEACGTKELYISLLGDFYKYIDMKANKIEKCLDDNMLRDYTIEVHALKNTSRMIGALELSEEFKHLEELGNKEDREEIDKLTPKALTELRALKPVLEPYKVQANENLKEVSKDEIIAELNKIHDAMDGFDLDGADEALKALNEMKLPDSIAKDAEVLSALVADVAIEDTMSLVKDMVARL